MAERAKSKLISGANTIAVLQIWSSFGSFLMHGDLPYHPTNTYTHAHAPDHCFLLQPAAHGLTLRIASGRYALQLAGVRHLRLVKRHQLPSFCTLSFHSFKMLLWSAYFASLHNNSTLMPNCILLTSLNHAGNMSPGPHNIRLPCIYQKDRNCMHGFMDLLCQLEEL
eukprot:204260-Pelagomonas_calceolata.AAC.1